MKTRDEARDDLIDRMQLAIRDAILGVSERDQIDVTVVMSVLVVMTAQVMLAAHGITDLQAVSDLTDDLRRFLTGWRSNHENN